MEIGKFASFNYAITYQMAGAVREFITENNPEDNVMDFLLENVQEKALKPHKKPLLFDTIELCLSTWIDQWTDFYDQDNWEELLNSFDIEYDDIIVKYEDYDDEPSYDMCNRFLEKGLERLTVEVFTLLFADRLFLKEYHLLISEHIKELKVKDYPELLEKDGVVKRHSYWYKWLVNALVHREKGKCAICSKDLTALYATAEITNHIDHIVPLKLGGTNDSTNLQVLCEKHNLEKGARAVTTTGKTPLFWDLDTPD